jgi:glycosyltransferase involved in cell wall biosynthesis
MQTLSVVVIALNEEKNLPDCLAGVAWADEIIVMDSGSRDRTIDVARTFTPHVFERTWDGYAAQRNAAHEKATGDWILSLDADERVTPELAAEIRNMLAQNHNDIVGYRLPYKVFYRDYWLRRGGFYPESHLRLFRRGHGAYGHRAVHEAIHVSGPVSDMKGHVLHYSYGSLEDFWARHLHYATLSAEEYHRQGRKTGPFRIIGHSAFTFMNMFILRLGFLDGYYGFLMASLYAMYTFMKYAELHERQKGETA